MENNEKQVNGLQLQGLEEHSEDWKRSIAAQVFLNYFFSLHFLIRESGDAYKLNKLTYFQDLQPDYFANGLSEKDKEAIHQHLLNAWNTEYALRSTARLGDRTYLRNALHWTFPQAYYSVFESLQAFLRLQGIVRVQPEQMQREAGRLITQGVYPKAVSFYASGHPLHPKIHGLRYGHYKPSLQMADLQTEAEAQIGQFLRTTRKAKAQNVRQQQQANPATALRSRTSGKVLKRFTDEHWEQLIWRIGYTNVFSFLLRLRISADHREITRFVEADIDFNLFHDSLQYIVGYLNFVHEAYIAKAMGLSVYQALVESLPEYLQQGFVADRLNTHIMPLLERKEVA